MNLVEAQVLLSMAAAYDNRKPDPDAAKAWEAALSDMRFEDCRAALIAHYRDSREWLMPVDIRRGVHRIRKTRLENHPPVTPPSDLDEAGYMAWLKSTNRRIADGEQLDPNGGRELVDRRSDLRELMATGAQVRGAESEESK